MEWDVSTTAHPRSEGQIGRTLYVPFETRHGCSPGRFDTLWQILLVYLRFIDNELKSPIF